MDEIESLISKFLKGQCQDDEIVNIEEHLRKEDIDAEINQALDKFGFAVQLLAESHHWERTPPDTESKLLLDKIKAGIHNKKPPLTIYLRYPRVWWIAATIILLIACIPAFFLFYNNRDIPGATTLTGAETQWGQKANLYLPDGSHVILNAGSRLIYPKAFGAMREVTLEGEGFFEIAEDSQKPFIVRAGDLVATVLGTSFNINAYPNQNVTQVAVIEGEVQVAIDKQEEGLQEKRHLAMKYLATYYKPKQIIKVETQYNAHLVAWKEGVIQFENTPFSEVANTLERWYGVKFSVANPPIGDCNIYGTFKNKSLKSVMDALQKTIDIHYKFEGNVVRVYGKGCER